MAKSQLLLMCIFVLYGAPSEGLNLNLTPKRTTASSVPVPVRKLPKNPVLEVKDTLSKANVVLVGVSHGAPASAKLVQDTIARVKPNVIVLELCNDRFLSISIDARLRPQGNATMGTIYDQKIAKIEELERESGNKQNYFMANVNFVRSQGLLVGTFIGMGLLVTGLQKLFRSQRNKSALSSAQDSTSNSDLEDEFVTAMRLATASSIPIRMGDANQEDTLLSVRQVISPETFAPANIIEGAKSLSFSSFGWTQGEYLLGDLRQMPQASRRPASKEKGWFGLPRLESGSKEGSSDQNAVMNALEESEWISIPKTYLENSQMLVSLAPLLAIALLVPVLSTLPFDQWAAAGDISNAVSSSSLDLASSLPTLSLPISNPLYHFALSYSNSLPDVDSSTSIFSQAMLFLSRELPAEVELTVDTLIDIVSVLLLIRLAKIIGSDRDRIIAQKIQTVCDEFPGQDIVCVLGMLHCNGVARYLLSGKDPMTVITDKGSVV